MPAGKAPSPAGVQICVSGPVAAPSSGGDDTVESRVAFGCVVSRPSLLAGAKASMRRPEVVNVPSRNFPTSGATCMRGSPFPNWTRSTWPHDAGTNTVTSPWSKLCTTLVKPGGGIASDVPVDAGSMGAGVLWLSLAAAVELTTDGELERLALDEFALSPPPLQAPAATTTAITTPTNPK